jgi:serine/threonine-protein kinase PpkA
MEVSLEFPGHRVLSPLGSGAMGAVYLGERLEPPICEVAIKVLKLTEHNTDLRERERFVREGEVLRKLRFHKHIVGLYQVGASPQFYFVMEYAGGGTLQERIRQHPSGMEWQEAARIVKAIASALDHLQQTGMNLVHRDIKPANILFKKDRKTPMLADFGITKLLDDATLTRTGAALGTLRYMAPEQILGKKPDVRADLYSLGCVFYELLTGDPPFKTDPVTKHLEVQPPRLPPQLAHLQRLLDDLLAKNRDFRCASPRELVERLTQLEQNPDCEFSRTALASTVVLPPNAPQPWWRQLLAWWRVR